ncbi:hypothetical protein Tco_0626978 [Tanacetum coccineum]|uniref:Reverse transcriptase Ty1/copia-type domain-containing protein n=1 Tax=Tanacetum coccineum TaxID=301880 RepID=A0ABQ4WL67_9ASTR
MWGVGFMRVMGLGDMGRFKAKHVLAYAFLYGIYGVLDGCEERAFFWYYEEEVCCGKQKEDGIFISQDKYVADILRKFGFTDVRTASTSMDTKKLM